MPFDSNMFYFDIKSNNSLTTRTRKAYDHATVKTFFNDFSTTFGSSNLSLLNPVSNLPIWLTTFAASSVSGVMATVAKQRIQRRKNLNLAYQEIVNNYAELAHLIPDLDDYTINHIEVYWREIDKIDNPFYRADLQKLALDIFKINLLQSLISKLIERKKNITITKIVNNEDDAQLFETIKYYVQSICDPTRTELNNLIETFSENSKKDSSSSLSSPLEKLPLEPLNSLLINYGRILLNTIFIIQDEEKAIKQNIKNPSSNIQNPANHLDSYQSLQNSELTYDEIASVTHKANRSFLYWFGMGLAGVIFLKLLFTPVGIIFGTIFLGYAVYKGYTTYKAKAAEQNKKMQDEEKLKTLIIHHELEFNRLLEKFKALPNSSESLVRIQDAWRKIDAFDDIKKSTIEQLKRDFLISFNQVIDTPSLYVNFEKSWISNLETALLKIVTSDPVTLSKSIRLNNLLFINNAFSKAVSWFHPLSKNSDFKSAKKKVVAAIDWIKNTVNYVNLAEEFDYADLINRFTMNAERYEKLPKIDKSIDWATSWSSINNIDDPTERCKQQDNFLKYAEIGNFKKLAALSKKVETIQNTMTDLIDFDSKATDYVALQTGQLTTDEKKRLSANTIRRAFSSGSLARGVLYMIAGASKIITEVISSVVAFAMASISGYERYSNSGRDKILRKRQETALKKMKFNQMEYDRLKTLFGDRFPIELEAKWQQVLDSGLEKITIVELQNDLLINLRCLKNSKNESNNSEFSEKINKIDTTLKKVDIRGKLIQFVKSTSVSSDKVTANTETKIADDDAAHVTLTETALNMAETSTMINSSTHHINETSDQIINPSIATATEAANAPINVSTQTILKTLITSTTSSVLTISKAVTAAQNTEASKNLATNTLTTDTRELPTTPHTGTPTSTTKTPVTSAAANATASTDDNNSKHSALAHTGLFSTNTPLLDKARTIAHHQSFPTSRSKLGSTTFIRSSSSKPPRPL